MRALALFTAGACLSALSHGASPPKEETEVQEYINRENWFPITRLIPTTVKNEFPGLTLSSLALKVAPTAVTLASAFPAGLRVYQVPYHYFASILPQLYGRSLTRFGADWLKTFGVLVLFDFIVRATATIRHQVYRRGPMYLEKNTMRAKAIDFALGYLAYALILAGAHLSSAYSTGLALGSTLFLKSVVRSIYQFSMIWKAQDFKTSRHTLPFMLALELYLFS